MTPLPEYNANPSLIYQMVNGRVQSRILLTAIELNLFDGLSAPVSAGLVSRDLGTHPGNTGLLLDGLAAAGLVQKENGQYQNTPDTQARLTRKSPAYVGEMLLIQDRVTTPALADMGQWVRTGPPETEPEMGAQELWTRYARSMANYQMGGCVQKMTRVLSARSEFAGMEKMLDLGGGHGLFCIAMVKAHPSMTGVVFDQPSVVEVAQELICEYGLEDRITTIGGDYTQDDPGRGYDLVWASSTLNFVRPDLGPLFETVYKALNPGGLFISLAEGVTHERTRPAGFVMENLAYALLGHDRMFDRGEIPGAMNAAGFSRVQSIALDTPMTPMELDIGKKSCSAKG